MNFRPLLASGVLAAVLVTLIAAEYHTATLGNVTLPATIRQPPPVNAGLPHDLAVIARDDVRLHVATILARPLFRADRRPPAGALSQGTGTGGLPRLTGIVVSPLGKSVIFSQSPNDKPIVVTEGGRIGTYVVTSIGAGQTIVAGPGGTKILRPVFGEAGQTAAVVTPAAPVAPSSAEHPRVSILDQLRNGPTPSVGIAGLTLPPDTDLSSKVSTAATGKQQ